jgi:hypothetical protein
MHNMLLLTYESIYQYDLSNLGVYQFAIEGILYLLNLVYTFHYNQHLVHAVGHCLLLISLYLFYLDLGKPVSSRSLTHTREYYVWHSTEKVDRLLEIITLVSSANTEFWWGIMEDQFVYYEKQGP